MKEYLVETNGSKYIVWAKDTKDAINQVLEKLGISESPDTNSRSLGSLHNQLGKILSL